MALPQIHYAYELRRGSPSANEQDSHVIHVQFSVEKATSLTFPPMRTNGKIVLCGTSEIVKEIHDCIVKVTIEGLELPEEVGYALKKNMDEAADKDRLIIAATERVKELMDEAADKDRLNKELTERVEELMDEAADKARLNKELTERVEELMDEAADKARLNKELTERVEELMDEAADKDRLNKELTERLKALRELLEMLRKRDRTEKCRELTSQLNDTKETFCTSSVNYGELTSKFIEMEEVLVMQMQQHFAQEARWKEQLEDMQDDAKRAAMELQEKDKNMSKLQNELSECQNVIYLRDEEIRVLEHALQIRRSHTSVSASRHTLFACSDQCDLDLSRFEQNQITTHILKVHGVVFVNA